MSPAERALWAVLRERPGGLKFRAQHPAEPYTLDFYCPAARLCIEVDGAAHDYGDRPQRDIARDAFLARHDIATLRIAGRDVAGKLNDVITHVVDTATARTVTLAERRSA